MITRGQMGDGLTRPAARIPLLGAGDRGLLRFAAWFLGILAALPPVFSPVVLLGFGLDSDTPLPGGVVGYLVMLACSTLFFGLPAFFAIRQLRSKRQPAVVIDGLGLRTVDTSAAWSVAWDELNGVVLSVRHEWVPPHSALYLFSRRFRERRRIALVFAPRDPAGFRRPGLVGWTGQPGWTAAMLLHDNPVTGSEDLVNGLASALGAFAPPGRFHGVWQEGRGAPGAR